jgi:hypothetical protein
MLLFQYVYLYVQKTQLMEKGNFRLFAANGKTETANFRLFSANGKWKFVVLGHN